MGVATAGLIVSAGVSAYTIASAEKKKSDAKKAIREFDRQEIINPYKDVQISKLKSEQQTNANLSNVATSVEALRRTGTRGVLGGIPKVNENSLLLQERISQDLERQEVERSNRIAQGELEVQRIREGRETGALAGLHNQVDTARHEQANAVGSLLQTGFGFAESQTRRNPRTKSIGSSLESQGLDFTAPTAEDYFSSQQIIL